MNIAVGQKAPDFSLFSSERTLVSLAEQKGKNVVLLFFPQAFTSVCTAELCNVRDNIALYNNTNATVYGISVDSVFTLAKYKEDQKLNFSLLSDFNKEVSAAYDSLMQEFAFNMLGVSKRSAFVIDKEGIVQYVEILDKVSDQPDFTRIQAILAKLG
jgi:glutaredoxin-dependent peroxiredoxin